MAFVIDSDDPEESPDAGAPRVPLRITVPTEENLEKAASKPGRFVIEDTPQEANPGIPFISEFKRGVTDLGSLAKDTVKSGYAFAHGEAPDLDKDPTPMAEALRQKRAAGTDDRHDYERAFLEGMGNSPGGKLLGAIGGILPEANVVNTVVNRWVNPTATKVTGVDPSELQLLEMAGMPAAGKVLKAKGNNLTTSDLPVTGRAAKMIANPIETTGKVLEGAAWPFKQAARPFVRGAIDIDNPITGAQGLENSLKSSTALEGERLGSKLGLNFSAGELTGNGAARGIEDALANSGRWGQKFSDANTAKTDAIVGNFSKVLDNIYGQETVPEDFGTRLSTAYNSTTDSLYKNRRAQAAIDFGAAYEGADDAGQYIPSNNLFRELYDIRQEGDARLLTKSKASGARLAKTLLNKIGTQTAKGNEMSTPLSIKELGNGLSDFGEEAANKELPEAERRTYTRLYSALQKDLDAEIAKPHGDPQKTVMLAVARDNFKNNSDQISDLQKTVLGNVIGGAAHDANGNITISPESLANKFNTLPASQLRQTLKFLDEHHPDVANMGRRYVLEQALRKAQDGVGLRGVGTTKQFGKADFAKALPDPARLNALLGDGNAYKDVTDIASATNRLIDWGAAQKGSQTFQRGNIFNLLHGAKGVLIKSIVTDNLAQDLLDPVKRRQMAQEAPLYKKALKSVGKAGAALWNDQTGALDLEKIKNSIYGKKAAEQGFDLDNVWYHGTSKDTDFKSIKTGSRGAFFTKDPDAASQYSVENDSMGHKFEHGNYVPTNTSSRVMPVFLGVKNTYKLSPSELEEYKYAPNYKKYQRGMAEKAKENGYDSVEYPDGSMVVFDPKHIKSVFDDFGAKGSESSNVVSFNEMRGRLGQIKKNASGPRGGVFSMDQYKAQPNPNMGGLGQIADDNKSVPRKMEWLRDNVPPQQIKQFELQSGKPLEFWDDQDVHSLHNKMQPSLQSIADDYVNKKTTDLGKIPQDLLEHVDNLGSLGFDGPREAIKALAAEHKNGEDWKKSWGLTPEEYRPINNFFANRGIKPDNKTTLTNRPTGAKIEELHGKATALEKNMTKNESGLQAGVYNIKDYLSHVMKANADPEIGKEVRHALMEKSLQRRSDFLDEYENNYEHPDKILDNKFEPNKSQPWLLIHDKTSHLESGDKPYTVVGQFNKTKEARAAAETHFIKSFDDVKNDEDFKEIMNEMKKGKNIHWTVNAGSSEDPIYPDYYHIVNYNDLYPE